jgi:hypothetical protein
LFFFFGRRGPQLEHWTIPNTLDWLAAMYFGSNRYCQRQVPALRWGREKFLPSACAIFVALLSWRDMMRTLKTEEMELVAGGDPGNAADNSQSTKNNGFGNGDQGAPGGSLPNNGAENDQTP